MLLVQPRFRTLDGLRRRILRETEDALLYGLQHPDSCPRIPTIEVGQGSFSRAFVRHFWARTLGIGERILWDA